MLTDNEQFTKGSKALHEVINLVIENCYLQVQGYDVGTPFICGAPGGGKTASLHYLSTLYNFGILSTHLALKPLEETGGIPQFENIIINGKPMIGTIWSFPDIMKTLFELASETISVKAKDKDGKEIIEQKPKLVIWLLDDAHLLSPIHMALLYELLTERSLRSYKLPQNVAIVMAGNTSNKSGAKTLFSAIVNRCVMMPVHTDFDGWKTNYALTEGVKIHPAVISFLGHNQYRKYFHEEEQVDQAWGSPRSWTRFAREILIREEWYTKTISSDICSYLGTGYVGKEGASDFVIYYKVYSEFDIDGILMSASSYELPDDPVKRYALAYALITNYIGRSDRSKYTQNLAYLIDQFMIHAPELSIMMLKEMKQLEKTLKKRNIVDQIILQIQKIDPTRASEVLKSVIEISQSMSEV